MRAATVSARVASEEFPPGVAERLVSRGASFDAALKSSENDAAGPRKMIGTDGAAGAKDELNRLTPALKQSEEVLASVRHRARVFLLGCDHKLCRLSRERQGLRHLCSALQGVF